MSTTIRPGEAALPGKKQYEKGFTLPELLVSLCILMILLQGVWQWGAYHRTDSAESAGGVDCPVLFC